MINDECERKGKDEKLTIIDISFVTKHSIDSIFIRFSS